MSPRAPAHISSLSMPTEVHCLRNVRTAPPREASLCLAQLIAQSSFPAATRRPWPRFCVEVGRTSAASSCWHRRSTTCVSRRCKICAGVSATTDSPPMDRISSFSETPAHTLAPPWVAVAVAVATVSLSVPAAVPAVPAVPPLASPAVEVVLVACIRSRVLLSGARSSEPHESAARLLGATARTYAAVCEATVCFKGKCSAIAKGEEGASALVRKVMSSPKGSQSAVRSSRMTRTTPGTGSMSLPSATRPPSCERMSARTPSSSACLSASARALLASRPAGSWMLNSPTGTRPHAGSASPGCARSSAMMACACHLLPRRCELAVSQATLAARTQLCTSYYRCTV